MNLAGRRGHAILTNGSCTGAVSIYAKEYDEAQKILDAMKKYLSFTDCSTPEKTVSSQDLDLNYGVTKINKSGCDLSFSIHLNAGGGQGCEVYYYKGSEKGQAAAKAICSALAETGLTNRGAKASSSYYELKHTKGPHVIIEVCFLDTKSDMNLYKSIGADKIARKIVKGLTGTEPKASSNTTSIKYQVIAGTYASKTNAEKQVSKLKDKGIDAFIQTKES